MVEAIIKEELNGTSQVEVTIDYSLFNECVMSDNEPTGATRLLQEDIIVFEEG